MSEKHERDVFAEHLNKKFDIHFDDENPTEAELVEVGELNKNETTESYSLTFATPLDAPPEQGVYKVKSGEMDEQEIFLVPVSQDAEKIKYQAIFNRLIEEKEK